jgi:alpha-glucoside transport system substrate-binding protein
MQHRGFSFAALVLLAGLILAACGGGAATQSPTAAPAAGGQATAAPAAGGGEATAVPAAAGDTGKVIVFGAFGGTEATAFEEVVKAFEAANPGIDVTYTGSSDFDTAIVVKIQAGDTPDIAGWPQPGGLARQARDGQLVPLWPEITALIDKNYPSFWKDLGSVDGKPYGVFHRVNAKGWIWYNKAEFEKAGYTAPKTWDELTALTEKMKASGRPPWCEGIESGAATGWKGTDWIENIMLRTQSVETYDKWIAGTLPFSSPEVKNAFEILGKIWLDPTAVYGGQQTIALTRVPDAANFLFDSPPKCWLHLQGSFVLNFFTNPDVLKNPDTYLGVFIMPPIDPNVTPALEVGGDVYGVLKGKDRPEVKKFMEFLTTWESGVPWAKQGGALFPYKEQDFSVYPTQIERSLAQTIAQAQAARFDASDAMSAKLNQAFWKGVTDWVSGNRDLDGALQDVDAAGK